MSGQAARRLSAPEPVRAQPVRAEPVRDQPGRAHPGRDQPVRARAPQPDTDARLQRRREARRRLLLIRRRRLDLLQDGALALILAVFVLIETAGLGVVAVLAVPTGLALVGSVIAERRLRGRNQGGMPGPARAAPPQRDRGTLQRDPFSRG